jgi:hypothetical protein
MKTKWIFRTLTVVMLGLIFSISQGADKFYYGSYGGREHAYMLKDSLKFNIIESYGVNSSNIDSVADGSLRAIVHATGENNPTDRAWNSHYTLWEAEGLQGSYYQLSYNGGTLVDDTSASGGKAKRFSPFTGSRLIQWGPTYYQESKYNRTDTISYTAEFCLKFISFIHIPNPNKGAGTLIPVCSLMVVDAARDSILKHTTLCRRDFAGGGYKTFKLADYTVLDTNKIEFQIYLFEALDAVYFYVDYVKVYDENGKVLMSGVRDSDIIAYVSQDWVHTTIPGTGDTVVYCWYGRDEPPSIDLYTPHVYIDSLLKEVSQARVLFQAYSGYWNPDAVHEYMLREDPKDYCIDPYPTDRFGNNYSGPAYQLAWDTYIGWLESAKIEADSLGKDLWVTVQAHMAASSKDSAIQNCHFPLIWFNNVRYCPIFREPTAEELRLQTFLCLCYGADAILHYEYGFRDLWWDSSMETGLYDNLYGHDSTTYKWREIKSFIGPRIETLSPIFNQLTWQGACSDDEVGSFTLHNWQDSYIDSIVGIDPASTYAQVGFFTDYWDDKYFMLVNRKCLEGESQDLKVYFNLPDCPYLVRDVYSNNPVGKFCAFSPFSVTLLPGEGRLFKIEKMVMLYPQYYVEVYPGMHPNIQEAIKRDVLFPI